MKQVKKPLPRKAKPKTAAENQLAERTISKISLQHFENRCHSILNNAEWRERTYLNFNQYYKDNPDKIVVLPPQTIVQNYVNNSGVIATSDVFDIEALRLEFEKKQSNINRRVNRLKVEIDRAKDRILLRGADPLEEIQKFEQLVNKGEQDD